MVKPRKQPPTGRAAPAVPVAPAPHDGDTERRILDAAHAVFLRSGTAGARMQEIAAEAGVNSALLHYYFRSKARLSEAVFTRAAGELFPAVARILLSELPLEQKVRDVVHVELDRLSAAPYLPAYIISELAHHPERVEQLLAALTGARPGAFGDALLRTVGAQIRAEVRAGRMRAVPPEQFLVNLLSMCIFPFAARPMFAGLMGLDGERFDRFIRERRRDLPEFFMKALRP